MKYPNFNEERKLIKKGYNVVVGLDEAGRGPLAGPVVACAFSFSMVEVGPRPWVFIKDSKQLSAKKREEIYNILVNHPDIIWGIGKVSEKVIDKINILEATKLAMKKAVKNLGNADFLLIDGNFSIESDVPQKSVVKGDQKVLSCSAASIIAKVYRDRIMIKYHKKYPQYAFDRHKGYGTYLHRQLIKRHGLCGIHRKTFKTT